jgi:inner membrane protein involved in colicin E2 resistance
MLNMTQIFNMSNPNIVNIGAELNTASDGFMGLSILIALYFTSFMIASKSGAKDGMAVSAFIGGIAAILLRLMGWIGNDFVILVAIIFMIGAGIMLVTRKD